jgi:hypothetical protein
MTRSLQAVVQEDVIGLRVFLREGVFFNVVVGQELLDLHHSTNCGWAIA